jgi:hypothetical protein
MAEQKDVMMVALTVGLSVDEKVEPTVAMKAV